MSWRRALPLVAVLLAWSGPAQAAQLDADGWWWRAQTGLAPVPPPPGVPDGGLVVGHAPDGATAITAVRFTLGARETAPVLRLVVADDQGGADAGLVACRATTQWQPAEAGVWGERPRTACERGSVPGTRASDGSAWTFALATLVRNGDLDVVIAPVGGGPAFQIAFARPTRSSLSTRTAGPAATPSPTPASPPPATGGLPLPPAPAPFPTLGPPSSPVATTVPSPVPTLSPQPAPTVATPPVAATPDDTADRAIGILLALLVAGAAVAVAWSPRLLAAPDPEAPRGLGRFARPRTEPPPPL